MGLKNSIAHAQRMIDTILRSCISYARAYINNIVVFSRSLQDHVRHLQAVFDILRQYDLSLKPDKAKIG